MKIYLSNYWNKNCLFILGMICMILLSTTFFCVWSNDEEDYVLIILVVIFVLLLCYLLSIAVKLVNYVVKENNSLVMYSCFGNKIASIHLDSFVFYEILVLVEGTFSKQKFIILSNEKFYTYNKTNVSGLGSVCKELYKKQCHIIMPYSSPYTTFVLTLQGVMNNT